MNKKKTITIILSLSLLMPIIYMVFFKETLQDKFLQCKAFIIIDRYPADGSNIYTSYSLVMKKQDSQNAEATFSGSIITRRDKNTETKHVFASNYFSYDTHGNRIDVFTRNVVIRPGNNASSQSLRDYVSLSLVAGSQHSYYLFVNETNIASFGEANFPRVACSKEITPP
ncbi:hypothetical protein I8H57_004563 [Enterobacter cloacae]|nr:hypothetical protein [Enterobacter cloacae]